MLKFFGLFFAFQWQNSDIYLKLVYYFVFYFFMEKSLIHLWYTCIIQLRKRQTIILCHIKTQIWIFYLWIFILDVRQTRKIYMDPLQGMLESLIVVMILITLHMISKSSRVFCNSTDLFKETYNIRIYYSLKMVALLYQLQYFKRSYFIFHSYPVYYWHDLRLTY